MVRTTAEVLPIYWCVSDGLVTVRYKTKTYEQNNGSVKKESNQCVGNESSDTETVDITHGKTGSLSKEGDDTVGDSAGRGVVVQRDQGIHLELGGAEQTLNHDKTEGLEDDTGNLDCMVVRTRMSNIPNNISHTEEADHLELDLAEGGNHNTDNNESHIAESLQVGRSDSESPGGQKGRNSVGGLKKQLGISIESSLEFEKGRRSQ